MASNNFTKEGADMKAECDPLKASKPGKQSELLYAFDTSR